MQTTHSTSQPNHKRSKKPDQTTAKVFMSGNSQAVRLPKAYRFADGIEQLDIKKVGDSLVLTPTQPNQSLWDDFVASLNEFDADFIECMENRKQDSHLADLAEANKNLELETLFTNTPDSGND